MVWVFPNWFGLIKNNGLCVQGIVVVIIRSVVCKSLKTEPVVSCGGEEFAI